MSFGGVELEYAKGINLPSYDDYKNLKSAKKLAIDIGGSLVKIVYLSEVEYRRKRLNSLSSAEISEENIENLNQVCKSVFTVEEKELSEERLYFKKFETKYVDEGLKFIKENLLSYGSDRSNKVLHATGGGAIKYKELIESTLDVKVEKEDEIECLINGCNFLLKNLQDESFTFQMAEEETPELKFQDLSHDEFFPYLLVNIGSGVSIIKVEGTDKYERIGGTSTGGGTFWGLGSLLTDAKGFDELLEMAIDGKTKNVDMLVKDIYGKGYDLMKLPAELVASSFGKACRASGDSSHKEETSKKFRPQDIAKALLRMISNDIGQISSLYAQVHGLKRIIFAGYFIRGHPVTMQTMSYAVKYFSKGSQQALFLRHEGYLGAIGAFLASAASINGSFHWNENYAALIATEKSTNAEKSFKIYDYETFELDLVEQAFEKFPLLVSNKSTHSDLINLGADKEAREYWLDKLENEMDAFMSQAVKSQSERKDSAQRGEQMKEALLKRLHHLRNFPYALGRLTVRSLLELCNQFLVLYDFNDTYLETRQSSTESALSGLPSYLKSIDGIDSKCKDEELIINLLAANSAQLQGSECSASVIMMNEQKHKMQSRPWLHDDIERWLTRMRESPLHKKVVVFVDKSGLDIVLGVFPFIRHLLQRGSKVVLAANTGFATNVILYDELVLLAERIGGMCSTVEKSLKNGDLTIMETGSCSQCLQLRVISHPLALSTSSVDLVVLVGVDRAIYTNFEEELGCETIRCAVIQDPWLANHLGGKVNDVVFKYT